jgi:hypothetical protein
MENVFRMAGLSSGTSVAVLEIGAARSAIGVLRDGHLRFAREIRAGGDGFTKALMEVPIHAAAGEFLDVSSAERMKRRHGILLHGDAQELGESGDRFSAMLRPQVERLVLEIKRSVEYYTQSINQEGVSELYLSGGGALLRNLAASLSEQLGMEVRDLPVRDCVKFSSEVVEQRFKRDAIVLSAAIGAALGKGKQLNLLPKAMQVNRTITKVRKWSQVAAAVALAALLSGYFVAGKDVARLERSIKGTKEAMSLLQDGLNKVETVETLQSQLASARDYIAQRRLHAPAWIGMLKEMSNIIPDDIELRQWGWSLDADPKCMVLRGKVLEQTVAKNLAISEFVLRLEGSPFFRDARLLPAQNSSDGKSDVFEISCELVY